MLNSRDVLGALLEGFTGEVQRKRQQREEQQSRLGEIFASARARAQAEREFPSAEESTRRRSLELITQLAQPRFGQGVIGPPTVDQEQAVGTRESELETLMRLLGRGTTAQGITQVFTANPLTGQIEPIGAVPRGARVITPPQIPVEKITAKESARSALRSLQSIRNLVTENPQALLYRGIPGIPGSRELERAFRSLRLEIVTARGGKQLTPSEIRLIESVFPNRVDAIDALKRKDVSVIQNKLSELETVARSLIRELPSSQSALETGQTDSGRMRVQRKSDGATGTLKSDDFDPTKYDRL